MLTHGNLYLQEAWGIHATKVSSRSSSFQTHLARNKATIQVTVQAIVQVTVQAIVQVILQDAFKTFLKSY